MEADAPEATRPTSLAELVRISERVAAADGRLEKVRHLAAFLDGLDPGEAPVAVAYLSGSLPDGKIGVGPATVEEVLPVEPAEAPALTLREVDAALRRIGEIGGPGTNRRRVEALEGLLARATREEQGFLVRLVLGELRQGAQEGLVLEAVAEATGTGTEALWRATMLAGGVARVARTALEGGAEALEAVGMRLFRPVQPMLAQTAGDVADALDRLGRAALEFKFDGARVQVHRRDEEVRVFSRRLNDVTDAVPELVEGALFLDAREFVLDGEALALREDGRPRPFQVTMRRFGRREDVAALRDELPVRAFFFDCLYVDGRSLVDRSLEARAGALERVVPEAMRAPRIRTGDRTEGEAFLAEALEAGHEGILAKDPASRYEAGRRGSRWLKVKPTYTADLVILAAEWGHGRREGWLSNVHLGARADDGFVMVGKTFKGMTDEMLAWQTRRLQELERRREGRTVQVEPRLVVEVAFDGVQRSPGYAGGVALRFARLKGYRHDKGPEEADTIGRLRELLPEGGVGAAGTGGT